MIIQSMTVGGFAANCYLLAKQRGGEGVLFDPGADTQKILTWVQATDVQVRWIVATHGHIDHIGALEHVRQSTRAKVVIHQADTCFLTDPRLNLSALLEEPQKFSEPEFIAEHGDTLEVGGLQLQFIHTPGHTPGSMSILVGDHVFTGDCLFADGVGRVDLPGGDWDALVSSVRQRLYSLPPATNVHPGHGPETTIERECRHNAYVRLC